MKNKILLKRQNGEYLSDPDSLEWGHVSVAYNVSNCIEVNNDGNNSE